MKKNMLFGTIFVLVLSSCEFVDRPCESMDIGLPPAQVWMEFRNQETGENVFDNGSFTIDDIEVVNEYDQIMSLSYQRIEGSLMFYFSPYEFNALNKVNVKILDEIDVRIEFQAHLNQWECNVTETLSDIEVINYGFEEIGMYGLSILID